MVTRSTKAAKAALVSVAAKAVAVPEYDRADAIARLANANAKERILILSALPMGEVAAIGGRVAGIGASVNEVLNLKLAKAHGSDWAQLLKATRADLCDADKERRKQVEAAIEGIRETVKTNSGGDDAKARDTIRRVKEWGLGIRKSKSTPNANKKLPIADWAAAWENFPLSFRRIKNDEMEDVSPEVADALLGVADAMAAFFTAIGTSPKAVIECKGPNDWKA